MTQLFLYFTIIISSPVSTGEAYGIALTSDVEYVSAFANQIEPVSSHALVNNINNDSDALINTHPIVTVKTTDYSHYTLLNSEILKSKRYTYLIRAPPLNSYLFV